MSIYDPELTSSEFTQRAWKGFEKVINDEDFLDDDLSSETIYGYLKKSIKGLRFCDYLRRYVRDRAGLTAPYETIPLEGYENIIYDSFQETGTPFSWDRSSTPPRVAIRHWLTQKNIGRSFVFLLGFGLRMSTEDVNELLTTGLCQQGINAKDPLELLCRYCYDHAYPYSRYLRLYQRYLDTPATGPASSRQDDLTMNVLSDYVSLRDDEEALLQFLATLKGPDNKSRISVTARMHFGRLYERVRQVVAEEEDLADQADGRTGAEPHRPEDITPVDIEKVFYGDFPRTSSGNLEKVSVSELHELFLGCVMSRQKIQSILTGTKPVTRLDLITMCFFASCHETEDLSDPDSRLAIFRKETDEILTACNLLPLYVASPYDCFIMMCVASEWPLDTYAEVWAQSYGKEI